MKSLKLLWQMIREEFGKKEFYLECQDNRCVYNENGSCQKNKASIMLDNDRRCMDFDFE